VSFLPDRIYGDDGRCMRCGVMPLVQSLGGDARKVLSQILHTAARDAGMLPPVAEMATLLGWPIARVDAAMEVLEERGAIAPIPDGLEGDFPGQYMAVWASHKDALLRQERRAQLAEKAVLDFEGQRDVERDLRARIVELESKLAGPQLANAKLKKANARIKELEDALELTQQMIERSASVPRKI